jgi:hypothetical protein
MAQGSTKTGAGVKKIGYGAKKHFQWLKQQVGND